jgi:sigma-B regulation protein RsbU (phosphoserine phosphatase)
MFITLLCFSLNTRTGEGECCSAGHERPLLCRSDGTVETLELPSGMAIGVMEEARYHSKKIRLDAGETLFTYTDGVSDAINPEQQCFTQKRLVQCLSGRGSNDLVGMIERVKRNIEDHTEAEPQADDITLAAVKFLGRTAKTAAPRVGI